MANFVLPVSAQPPFQTTVRSNPISLGFCFLVSDNRNQTNKQKCLREVLPQQPKLSRKWASVTLIWSLNPWISCAWSILSKGPAPPPLSLTCIFMESLPRYKKTYNLLCTISLEYSVLKFHQQSFLWLFLQRPLHNYIKQKKTESKPYF